MKKITIILITLLLYPYAMADKPAHFLYRSRIGKAMRPLLTNKFANYVVGFYADSEWSKRRIKKFVKQYKIDMQEAAQPDLNEYKTFNDFFTRKLKPNARPINAQPDSIICPCDGYVYAATQLTQSTTFEVKGRTFTLQKFLKNKELAQEFIGGSIVILYLAPQHYHRFHFPVDGMIKHTKKINGNYESVHESVYHAGLQPLHSNERQFWHLRTADGNTIGFVPVGALCVGKINRTAAMGNEYKKGDEAGFFSFGGSTIVLLFKKDYCTIDSELIKNLASGTIIEMKMGQKIGTISHV
jgi:phosphatidylserine decarboxylase